MVEKKILAQCNLQPTKPISKMGGAPVSITLRKLLVATTNVTHLILIFLQKLTNQDHNIWNTTYEELKALDLPTSLKYGKCF